jgi:hypothetical protein
MPLSKWQKPEKERFASAASHGNFVCGICKVRTPSQQHLDQHLSGGPHKAKANSKAPIMKEPFSPVSRSLSSVVSVKARRRLNPSDSSSSSNSSLMSEMTCCKSVTSVLPDKKKRSNSRPPLPTPKHKTMIDDEWKSVKSVQDNDGNNKRPPSPTMRHLISPLMGLLPLPPTLMPLTPPEEEGKCSASPFVRDQFPFPSPSSDCGDSLSSITMPRASLSQDNIRELYTLRSDYAQLMGYSTELLIRAEAAEQVQELVSIPSSFC